MRKFGSRKGSVACGVAREADVRFRLGPLCHGEDTWNSTALRPDNSGFMLTAPGVGGRMRNGAGHR
jgi:hypothetical protein